MKSQEIFSLQDKKIKITVNDYTKEFYACEKHDLTAMGDKGYYEMCEPCVHIIHETHNVALQLKSTHQLIFDMEFDDQQGNVLTRNNRVYILRPPSCRQMDYSEKMTVFDTAIDAQIIKNYSCLTMDNTLVSFGFNHHENVKVCNLSKILRQRHGVKIIDYIYMQMMFGVQYILCLLSNGELWAATNLSNPRFTIMRKNIKKIHDTQYGFQNLLTLMNGSAKYMTFKINNNHQVKNIIVKSLDLNLIIEKMFYVDEKICILTINNKLYASKKISIMKLSEIKREDFVMKRENISDFRTVSRNDFYPCFCAVDGQTNDLIYLNKLE